jgi:hypothetical protein
MAFGALPCESHIQLQLRPVINLRGGGKRQPEKEKNKRKESPNLADDVHSYEYPCL